MSEQPDHRLPLFVAGVTLASAAALAAGASHDSLTFSPILLALTIVAMLADALTVEVSSVTVSMMYPVLAATTILFGPSVGGLTAAIAAIPSGLMAKQKRIMRTAFNAGQLGLAFLLGGWVFQMTGGRPLMGDALGVSEIPGVLIPLALLAVVSLLVNTTLVAVVVNLDAGVPFLDVWKSSFAWTIPTQASMAVLSLALAEVVAAEGVLGLALFVVPLLIARKFYESYLTLRRTYADTVRSLVAVIEAKDAYTRGHSERVAKYCVGIAERMGFDDERVGRLELAALLHDLGKVGISRAILSKNSRLSDDEFAVIKTHPEIGARIIEGVPFLADLVPVVSSHHERVDGTGYGQRLSAEDIPLEAKILSVADSFDAMTSSRPYRDAMSYSETISELRRCAGLQFDQVIVEIFIESLGPVTAALPGREEGAHEAV